LDLDAAPSVVIVKMDWYVRSGCIPVYPLTLMVFWEHGSSSASNATPHLSVKHIKQWQPCDADTINLGLSRTPPSSTKIWTICTAMSRGGAKQSTVLRVTRYLMVYDTFMWQMLTLSQDITECWLDTDQDVSRWLEEVLLDGGREQEVKSTAKSKTFLGY
jgi:hypothetical protein